MGPYERTKSGLFAVLCVWCGWLLPTPECVHVRVRELGGSLLLI